MLERDKLLALLDECADAAGGEPPTVPLMDAEINQFYDREIEAYHCLVDHGYDPPEPPTREVYLASWDTGPWSPHHPPNVATLPADECPMTEVADIDW